MTEAPPSRLSAIERQAILSAALVLGSVLALLLAAYLGFDALSSARAYVGGEGQWSKAQKDAVYYLTRYAASRNPIEYDAYLTRLQVPLGDRTARLELERLQPNRDSVQAGFLRGRNHPDDIPGMARFFRRFHRVPFVADAIGYWRTGDSLIARLQEIGARLHREVESPRPDEGQIQATLAETDALSAHLTRLENAFSASISAGARWATQVFLALISTIAALLLLWSGWSLYRGARKYEAVEASRTESERRLREMVREASVGISRTALDGGILSANPALVGILRYDTESELLQRNIRDLHVDAAARERLVARLKTEGSATTETELRRRDGSVAQVRLHARLVRDARGAPVELEGFCEDITEQRRLQAELQRAQKLETVGQLTGAIAHEFNNLLTLILASADLIDGTLARDGDQPRSDLAELKAAARRGAEMVRRLLALSRDRQLQFEPHAVGPIVERYAAEVRQLLADGVQVEVEIDEAAPLVRTDPAAIHQILFNLVANARDAMPNGGCLRIAVSRVSDATEHAVLLSVSDNGSGMDGAVLGRIFEPFYTTRPPGERAGLGLTMVHALVQQHSAAIEVDSTPGQGTSVRICFPAESAGAMAVEQPSIRPPDQPWGTLLLVEDEDALRRATQRLLERQGFRVLGARNGREALALCEAPGAGIDVILSDVVMPEMSGTMLCEELRRREILIPILLTSGYTARDAGGPIDLPDGVPFIPKPWEMDRLLEQLARVLGRMPPTPPA
jgi:PAS domain S-box-containing protein